MKPTESTSSAQVLKKTQPEEFDLVILGGGTGSTIAAWTFAGEGKQVAVVERKYIGGSCPNIAYPAKWNGRGHSFALRVQRWLGSRGATYQLAPKRYREQLSIPDESGPRNNAN